MLIDRRAFEGSGATTPVAPVAPVAAGRRARGAARSLFLISVALFAAGSFWCSSSAASVQPDPMVVQKHPANDTASLGVGRYARMSTLLERTIFKVDVLTLEIRFGEATDRRLEELIADRRYSSQLADSIAEIAVGSENAWAVMEFKRGVSLDQFVDGVRDDMGRARDAGIITDGEYDMIADGIPQWFAFLEERRIQKGDQIFYRIRGDTLRTQFRSVDGETLLEQTDVGPERRLAVLGSYLAPKSSLRKGLVQSLFLGDVSR
ncbi:MAG: hypothetical protein V3T08_00155 [Gemmatimonadota bacterium]